MGDTMDDPILNPEAFRASSATSHFEDFAGNPLIIHSIDDEVIPYEGAVRVVQRLLDLGKENWDFATYPVGWHCFGQGPELRPDAYRRTIELFNRAIGTNQPAECNLTTAPLARANRQAVAANPARTRVSTHEGSRGKHDQ
jgi:dipeptidyl aminopeptidase/acylaminoacyl peptidase